MSRYEHTATLTSRGTATVDENGNWVEGATVTQTSVCRDEPNSGGQVINLDGQNTVYSSMVYFPVLETVTVEAGMGVSVAGLDGDVILTGTIKRVEKTKNHVRAWV